MRLLAALCLLWITSAWAADVRMHELPLEARVTLQRIHAGGPFPYPQDGRSFSNREHLLPTQRRGYYREYTVPTPRLRERGARRIVSGRGGEFYYTDDHYRSFKRILE
jgi:ribonuclease T1